MTQCLVVIGEALVDLVWQPGTRTLTACPGGSPANVALGLARLDHPVTLLTRLGADPFGEMILAHLAASGVAVEPGLDPEIEAGGPLPRSSTGTYWPSSRLVLRGSIEPGQFRSQAYVRALHGAQVRGSMSPLLSLDPPTGGGTVDGAG